MKGILDKLEKGIIVTDEEGYICYGNIKILKQINKGRQEIEGQLIGELLDDVKLPVEGAVRYCTYLEKGQTKKEYIKLEVVKGEWNEKKAYYYLIDGTPETVLENILDKLPVTLWIKDINRQFCYVNEHFLKQEELPYTERDKIIGRVNEELFEAEKAAAITEGEEAVYKTNQSVIYEKEIIKDSHPQYYYFQIIPLGQKDGKAEYVLGAAWDITLQRQRERESQDYKKKREIEELRNEFFANASHEFRTPINIILASTQLLAGGKTESQEMIQKYTSKIKQNAYRLLKLSNNIIDLTQMSIGHENLYLENHNMVNIVEEVTLAAVEYAGNNGIELIFDTEIEELIMAVDVEKIERIMLNLLSNAVKFTPRNGSINVNIFREGEKAVITVSDTGVGIPEDKSESIFERFAQVDTSFTRKSEGTGMGLSIVKAIVDMYGGRVYVDSRLGEGTVFTVELPIHILENKEIVEDLKREDEELLKKCSVEFADVYSY